MVVKCDRQVCSQAIYIERETTADSVYSKQICFAQQTKFQYTDNGLTHAYLIMQRGPQRKRALAEIKPLLWTVKYDYS